MQRQNLRVFLGEIWLNPWFMRHLVSSHTKCCCSLEASLIRCAIINVICHTRLATGCFDFSFRQQAISFHFMRDVPVLWLKMSPKSLCIWSTTRIATSIPIFWPDILSWLELRSWLLVQYTHTNLNAPRYWVEQADEVAYLGVILRSRKLFQILIYITLKIRNIPYYKPVLFRLSEISNAKVFLQLAETRVSPWASWNCGTIGNQIYSKFPTTNRRFAKHQPRIAFQIL